MGKRYISIIISGMLLMIAAVLSMAGPSFFIVPITKDLGFTVSEFSMIRMILSLMAIPAIPIISRKVIPVIGLRKTALIGGLLGAGCWVLFSLSSSLWSFYLVAVLLGILSLSCTLTIAINLVSNWFEKKRGSIMGLVSATTGLGGVVLGLTIPTIIVNSGWRTGFLVFAAIQAIAIILAVLLMRNTPEEVNLLPYGASADGKESSKSGLNKGNSNGMSYKEALRSPVFYLISITFVLFSIANAFSQQSQVLFVDKGLTLVQAGQLGSFAMIAMMISKILMGYLNDKIGSKQTYSIFSVLFMISLAFYLFGNSYNALLIGTILLGFGVAVTNVLNQLIALDIFGNRDFTSIWGILSMAGNVGFAIGAPIWGFFYDAYNNYILAIICCIIILAVNIVTCSLAIKLKKPTKIDENLAQTEVAS